LRETFKQPNNKRSTAALTKQDTRNPIKKQTPQKTMSIPILHSNPNPNQHQHQDTVIFMSAQQTPTAFAVFREIQAGISPTQMASPHTPNEVEVLASIPEFNVRNADGTKQWNTVITESSSVKIPPLTKLQLFKLMRGWFRWFKLGDSKLMVALDNCMSFSTFGLSRMDGRGNPDSYGKMDLVFSMPNLPAEAAENIKAFIVFIRGVHQTYTEEKTPIDVVENTVDAYLRNLNPNYRDLLHYDHILQIFGVEAALAEQIAQTDITDRRGNTIKVGHEALRVLSDACLPVNFTGSAADYGNLLHQLTGKYFEELPKDLDGLISMIDRVPRIAFIDGERDDIFALMLLVILNSEIRKCLTDFLVVLQVPPGFDKTPYINLFYVLQVRYKIFEDPDSENIKALNDAAGFIAALTDALTETSADWI